MIIRAILIIAAMVIISSSGYAATLQGQAAAVAEKYVGKVTEKTNRNDHPQISKWLKELGLPPGLSWCAAAVVGIYREAAETLHTTSPIPRTGRCSALWDACQRNQMRFQTFSPHEAMMLGLQPGDLVVWRHGKGVARNFDGHIGIVPEKSVAREYPCDEGNTVRGSSGGQREQSAKDRNQGGYYRKNRSLGFGTSFAVEGIIRLRGGEVRYADNQKCS